MVKEIRARQVGGSVAATLPKEMAERFKITAGSILCAIDTADGILLTPFDSAFAQAMRTYREGAAGYRNALRELAKGPEG
jgi:bifunctional DNA-binding transcriptional regulator/antitoxin component of YhaV-PrlF toxin-antitoxin module